MCVCVYGDGVVKAGPERLAGTDYVFVCTYVYVHMPEAYASGICTYAICLTWRATYVHTHTHTHTRSRAHTHRARTWHATYILWLLSSMRCDVRAKRCLCTVPRACHGIHIYSGNTDIQTYRHTCIWAKRCLCTVSMACPVRSSQKSIYILCTHIHTYKYYIYIYIYAL